jgi:hypothetical protein
VFWIPTTSVARCSNPAAEPAQGVSRQRRSAAAAPGDVAGRVVVRSHLGVVPTRIQSTLSATLSALLPALAGEGSRKFHQAALIGTLWTRRRHGRNFLRTGPAANSSAIEAEEDERRGYVVARH